MSILNQKTLKQPINFSGIGLHSGKKSKLTINPSSPNSGIIFKRVDLQNNNIVLPVFENVSNTLLNTTISNEFGVKISTIEHLMGALFGLGIDNALIEIDNEEIPILDGSAKEFVKKINLIGLSYSDVPIKIVKINKKIEFVDGERKIKIEPSKLSLDIDFQLKYLNEIIGNQRNKVDIYQDNLMDVFNSRTFCLYEDIEKLKSMGFAKGGSLDNALVVKGSKLLNKEGLRNRKEFVNHKILDCMGDLFLSGYKIIGKIRCSEGGHKLTNDLLRKVFQNKENYSIYEINEKNIPHSLVYRQNLKSIA